MKFVDRQRELALLDQMWTAREARFLVLYGRRRVGKTRSYDTLVALDHLLGVLALEVGDGHEVRKQLIAVVGHREIPLMAR